MKNKHDKISVIVPVYNVQEYLEECINSLLNQTYSNIEIILINDASTDNSIDICKEYSKKNKNILLIDNKVNGGLAHVRNIGLEKATGKYLMFLDSDDKFYDNSVEILYNTILETKADIVVGKLNSFNSSGEYGYYSDKFLNKPFSGTIDENKNLLNCISCCSKIYETSFAKKFSFLEKTAHEDNSFTLLCYFNAKKIVVVPQYFYYRRVRESNDSIMQNLNIKTYNGLIKNFECVLDNLKDKRKIFLDNFIVVKTANYIVKNLNKKDYNEAYLIGLNLFKKYNFDSSTILYYKLRFNISKIVFGFIKRS